MANRASTSPPKSWKPLIQTVPTTHWSSPSQGLHTSVTLKMPSQAGAWVTDGPECHFNMHRLWPDYNEFSSYYRCLYQRTLYPEGSGAESGALWHTCRYGSDSGQLWVPSHRSCRKHHAAWSVGLFILFYWSFV